MNRKILRVFVFFISMMLLGNVIFYLSPEEKLYTDKKIDLIIIIKHERKLIVYSKGEELKTYKISLGGNPVGKKRFEGDNKTPEGVYYIDSKNPNSSFHLNLGVSYPNKEDRAYAKKYGRSAGGLIKIHGLKNGRGFIGKFHRLFDWTKGCIALTNKEIEELYNNVPIDTKIEIRK